MTERMKVWAIAPSHPHALGAYVPFDFTQRHQVKRIKSVKGK